jgi:hypothetical protein
MKPSLLIYSVWISLVLMTGVSCQSARVSYSGIPVDPGFFEKMTYKTTVTWGEREISGLMLVKKMEDGNVKIAFYNEMGMTYLEGLLDRSSKHPKLIVKNIAPAINYKPFIRNFEKCITTMFPNDSMLSGSNFDVSLKNGFKVEINSSY